MKKLFLCLAVLAVSWLGSTAVAEDYSMPQYGYETKTVSKDAPLTFYDFKGASSHFTQSAFSTVIFQPATEGYSIKITFEELTLTRYSASWDVYMRIYNGEYDVEGTTYPTSGNPSGSFAENANQIAYIPGDGAVTPLPSYVSGAADGCMSVCLYSKDPSPKESWWKATVEEVLLETMTVKSAAGDNSFVDGEVWAGKANVAAAGFNIVTEGYSSPDKLQSLTFTCSNAAVLNPTALKLYSGQAASVAGLTEIGGAVAESAGVYTFTLTEPLALSNGTNTFSLGGDILSSAAFNATTTVTVTGIATAGGFNTFTPADAKTLTVQPMYLMATDATYEVGECANFYDEGGKDGKVIKGFDGKVVFEPASNGKKVQLTFKEIEVFYTDYAASSTGYVDFIKVYNGNSTDEKDLLWQISQATASSTSDIVIKSTAADGKLTVTHKCNISYESNLKNGWSASVCEFAPQPMVISYVENTKQTANVAAGTENALLATIHITTAETEPALVVKSLALNTNNTNAQINKLRLYYTKYNTFAKTNLLGEAEVSANAVVINATNEVSLLEGDNYLWLAADIAATALNEQKADAVLEKLTFTNSTEYTAFAAVEGGLTIENKAIQACGSQTFSIQGTWQYTHTVASEYSTKYKAEECDQTIVFKPMHEGYVIQIDYTDFDVYYATSSYSTRAKYIVYAGEGTSGEKLWELDANGKKPEQIRSTAADGALTIVFNPNTSYSSYTGNGWHATVREYKLQNMFLQTTTVGQASTKLVKLGERKAALLNVDVETEGTLNPLTLDALTLNLKGSEANLSKVYLLQGETVLAEAAATATTTLTLATPAELAEYHNNFVIAADVKDDATIDTSVDAALTAVTLSANAVTVENGDPEGSRVIKNVINIAAGDNGTVTIGANSLMFYDDGGADENYGSNFEGYVTFKPADAGYAVELVFKDFDIAYLYGGDPFNIYYSDTYDAEATPDKKFGMYSKPAENESVISAAENGAMTVYVEMPSSRMRGFEVEVRQHLLTDLAVDSVLVSSLAPAEATKGTSDLQWLCAAVYVSGDRKPLTITGFEQTASALLTDRHIYTTGHSATFSTANEFTDSYVINEKGVYFFWFVGSISSEAEVGDKVSLAMTNIVFADSTIAPKQAVTATVDVVSGAHGYYRIGASSTADYVTLTAALQVIASIGMDGAVTLAVESGTYTEQVTVPEISGAGAENSLTIRSVSGDYNDVTYQFSGNTLSQTKGVFTIAGADYVTVKGISFTSTFTSNQTPTVVVVNNAATHVTIDSCRIYAERYTEYTSRLDLLRVDAGENLFNNDFALTNSVLEGGYMGLAVAGHKAATDPLQQNMLIQGNRFRNQGNQMIYGDAVSNLQIIGNTFRGEAKKSNFCAIDWLLVGETATIAYNDIYFTALAADDVNFQALYFRPNSYQDKENAVLRIINNVVNVQNASTYASYCINFNSNLPKLLVAYNTMVLNSAGTAASPFYIQAAPVEGSRFVNNIFQATNKGYAVRYKNANAANSNISYEHNILYTPEATFGMPTASVGTFADWKTQVGATDEQGNLNETVVFASASLLIPKQDNEGHLLTAAVLDFVTTDITGKERSTTPTIGAYEYDPDLFLIPAFAEGYPTVQNIKDTRADVVLKTDNLGTAKVLVLQAAVTAPDVATIVAEGAEVILQKGAEVSLTVNGLEEETSYKAYVVTLSPLGEPAEAVVATEVFTTQWTLRPVELAPIAKRTVAANAAVTLTATLETEYEQAKPYTYSWRTAFDAAEIGNEATLSITATTATEYICQVTDKFGQQASVSAHVLVEAKNVATFEEYVLPEGGHKMVDDAWEDEEETYLYSGSYAFGNVPNKAFGAYMGYVISADQSNEAVGYYAVDQYRSAAGGAYEGTNFAVAYYAAPSTWYEGYRDPIVLTYTAEAQTISGFYITNSAYTMNAILKGDYANPAFGKGDYLSLTIKGFNGETSTGEIVYYLADYRSEDATEHFALKEWKWLDLSSLGAVTRLEFDMFTTKSDAYGFTTPTYFCLDNFGGEAPSPGTGVDNTTGDAITPVQHIENGILFITLPDGSQYDVRGMQIK